MKPIQVIFVVLFVLTALGGLSIINKRISSEMSSWQKEMYPVKSENMSADIQPGPEQQQNLSMENLHPPVIDPENDPLAPMVRMTEPSVPARKSLSDDMIRTYEMPEEGNILAQ